MECSPIAGVPHLTFLIGADEKILEQRRFEVEEVLERKLLIGF